MSGEVGVGVDLAGLFMAIAGVKVGEDLVVAYDSPDPDAPVVAARQIVRRPGFTPPDPLELSGASAMLVMISSEVAQPFELLIVLTTIYHGRSFVYGFTNGGVGLVPEAEWDLLHVHPPTYAAVLMAAEGI